MKRCSTSHVIRKLQIETIRYHYIPIRMAKIWNIEASNIGEMWSSRRSHALLEEMQNGTSTLEDSLVFFLRLNILLSHDPAVMLLVFTQISWKHMYTNIPALAWLHTRNQQMCFLIGEWINKFCYVHTKEFSPVLKMCELSGHWEMLNSMWKKPIWKVRIL